VRVSSASSCTTSWRRAASQRRHQQRRLRRRAHEPHHARELLRVDAAAGRDVQQRRLRERADDLVRRGEHRVGALLQRRRRQRGMEAEVRPPRLVDHERDAGRMADLGAAGDVGGHPVVRRRDDERRPRLRRVLERRGQRLGHDAVRHAQPAVVLGRDEGRHAARQHEPVDHRRVRVALEHHALARTRQGQAQRVVALRRPVGQEPRARGAVRLGGELLGALVGRRRRPEVDAHDVLRDVERQRVLAERPAQPRVRARACLVAGHVKARGAAEAVGDDRVEVGRGRLVARDDLPRADGHRRVGVGGERHP
jgi:hypothetical protein